jgi:hypothetical protein
VIKLICPESKLLKELAMNRFSLAGSISALAATAVVAACAGQDPAILNAPAAGIPSSDSILTSEDAAAVQHIFVGNYYGSDVTVYKWAASGNVVPYGTIVGPFTGLDHPSAIAVDSTGLIYVGNYEEVGADVVVFASGANGDATPVKTLTGPTGFDFSPNQFAVDAANDLYVAETGSRVDVFAPTATATSAPIRSIHGFHTGLVLPTGVALDASRHIFVCDSSADAIFEFGAGANGDATPLAIISGADTGLDAPGGIAIDGSGRIYVSQQSGHDVEEFAKGSNGDATPIQTYSTGTEMPTSVGTRGTRIFVTEISVPTYVYAVDVLDTGSLTLVHSIEGASTGLDWGAAVTAR